MKLTMTFINHIKALRYHLLLTMLVMGYALYIQDESSIRIMVKFWLIFSIPVLYIHIRYILLNYGQTIEVTTNSLVFRKNDLTRVYPFSELKRKKLYMSANMDAWGMPFTTVESYYHLEIITNDNSKIIISCLMSTNLIQISDLIKNVPYERKKGFSFLWE